jgi:hypothetical protein
MGHAGKGHERLYDKIKEDVSFRRKWAEPCGVGFALLALIRGSQLEW